MDESEIIQRYFPAAAGRGVHLGIGDDAALLEPTPGRHLVAATDTLVAGQHFTDATPAAAVGYRALAVNLSDIAAMGAEPAWCLLALTLPEADPDWLEGFAAGLSGIARDSGCPLVGGDTTRGPLTVSITVLGEVEPSRALTRGGARAGDLVCVTGRPGDAMLGLDLQQGRRQAPAAVNEALLRRLFWPSPRLAAGRDLAGVASACIDISDGLAQDLARLTRASGVGAGIRLADLPLSEAAAALVGDDPMERARVVLAGGDDYELLFTLPPDGLEQVRAAAQAWDHDFHVIGRVEEGPGIIFLDAEDRPVDVPVSGWDPFRD